MKLRRYGLTSAAVLLLLSGVVSLAPSAFSAGTPAAMQAASTAPPLDINTAKKDELQRLNGIGPVYAEAIIKNRPYARKDELVSRKVIPQATYDKIKDLIIAKQKK